MALLNSLGQNLPLSANSPLDALWRAPVLITVLLAGEGLALILALAPGVQGDRGVYFGLSSLAVQWIALLTLGALYLLRHSLHRLQLQHLIWVALGFVILSAWMIGGAAWILLGNAWITESDSWVMLLLRLSAIALIVGSFGVAALQIHWRSQQWAMQAQQSELGALRARIRPHFLFNTLNTAAAPARARPDETEKLLLDLADLFRAALAGPHDIALADELALTQRYLDIEALRFGDRLKVMWELPATIPDVQVPALSIQPLAENAIRHGIEPLLGGGQIDLQVTVDDQWVRIVIKNDLADSGPAQPGHQIGLNSARERVRAISKQGDLDTSIVDGRYVATITLPLNSNSILPTRHKKIDHATT